MFTAGRPLHAETQRHLRRCVGATDGWIEDLDLLIRGLVDAGFWDRLFLITVAGPNAADSLLNLKEPAVGTNAPDSTTAGTPTFVADQGYTTVVPTSYMKTGWFGHVQDSAMFSAYIRSVVASGDVPLLACENWNVLGTVNMYDMRVTQNYVGPAGAVWTRMQQVTAGLATGCDAAGFRAASRLNASDLLVHTDGITVSTSQASTFFTNAVKQDPWVGVINRKGVAIAPVGLDAQFAHWGIGLSFDETQLADYHTLIKDYFTRRGTAV